MCRLTRPRIVTNTRSVCHAARKSLRVASATATPSSPATRTKDVRASISRLRSQRTADGSSMSGRSRSAAASILRAVAACALRDPLIFCSYRVLFTLYKGQQVGYVSGP